MGADLLATKIRFCKHTSLKTYMREVENAVKNKPPDDPYLPHVEQRYRAFAQRNRGGSAAHNLTSGLRALEKVGLLPPGQVESQWVYAKAIDKATAHNVMPRRWTTTVDIQILGGGLGTLGPVTHLLLLSLGSGILRAGGRHRVGMVGIPFHPTHVHLLG